MIPTFLTEMGDGRFFSTRINNLRARDAIRNSNTFRLTLLLNREIQFFYPFLDDMENL